MVSVIKFDPKIPDFTKLFPAKENVIKPKVSGKKKVKVDKERL